MRVTEPTLVWLSVNHGNGVTRRLAGPVTVNPAGDFATASFTLPDSGSAKALRLDFVSEPGTFVEIDNMGALGRPLDFVGAALCRDRIWT